MSFDSNDVLKMQASINEKQIHVPHPLSSFPQHRHSLIARHLKLNPVPRRDVKRKDSGVNLSRLRALVPEQALQRLERRAGVGRALLRPW